MCLEAPFNIKLQEGPVSLPEEPEHVSSHKRTAEIKTYLQCGCDHIERVDFVVGNSSCRESGTSLALALQVNAFPLCSRESPPMYM